MSFKYEALNSQMEGSRIYLMAQRSAMTITVLFSIFAATEISVRYLLGFHGVV